MQNSVQFANRMLFSQSYSAQVKHFSLQGYEIAFKGLLTNNEDVIYNALSAIEKICQYAPENYTIKYFGWPRFMNRLNEIFAKTFNSCSKDTIIGILESFIKTASANALLTAFKNGFLDNLVVFWIHTPMN